MKKYRRNIIDSNPSGTISSYTKRNSDSEYRDVFIGIVRNIVHKDSDNLLPMNDIPDKYKNVLDNRNLCFVTPLDGMVSNIVTEAYFINNHDIDYPLKGEAVLVITTEVGNIIIDRLSIYGFGLNYDISGYLTSGQSHLDSPDYSLDFDTEEPEDFVRENISKVAPFYGKKGSRTFLGRNNQYIIMDSRARIDSSSRQKEYTNEGKFIKFGFRKDGKQTDSNKDNQILITENALLQFLLSERIPSEYNIPIDDEPDEGVGIQSKEIILKGDFFVAIYSKEDMLLKSKRLYLESELLQIDSNRVNLQKDASNPAIRGKELKNALGDLLDIIENMVVATPTGPARLDPITSARVKEFKARYTSPNSPNYFSRKVYVDN